MPSGGEVNAERLSTIPWFVSLVRLMAQRHGERVSWQNLPCFMKDVGEDRPSDDAGYLTIDLDASQMVATGLDGVYLPVPYMVRDHTMTTTTTTTSKDVVVVVVANMAPGHGSGVGAGVEGPRRFVAKVNGRWHVGDEMTNQAWLEKFACPRIKSMGVTVGEGGCCRQVASAPSELALLAAVSPRTAIDREWVLSPVVEVPFVVVDTEMQQSLDEGRGIQVGDQRVARDDYLNALTVRNLFRDTSRHTHHDAYGGGEQPSLHVLVKCGSVNDVDMVSDLLRSVLADDNVWVGRVHSDSSSDDRVEGSVRAFRDRAFAVICVCEMLIESWDCPQVDVAVRFFLLFSFLRRLGTNRSPLRVTRSGGVGDVFAAGHGPAEREDGQAVRHETRQHARDARAGAGGG